MSRFKYLGYEVSYESDADMKGKINKFKNIYTTIHLRNKTVHNIRIKFYKNLTCKANKIGLTELSGYPGCE